MRSSAATRLSSAALFFGLFLLLAGSLFFTLPRGAYAQELSPAQRAQLEEELRRLEGEIENQQKILQSKQKESVSLERDIAILNAKITEAKLSIKARNLSISKLSQDIRDKENSIGVLSGKIGKDKQSIAQLIRKSDQINSSSLPEMFFSGKSLSEFFAEVDEYTVLRGKLRDTYKQVEETRSITEDQKKELEDKRQEESDLRAAQEAEKRRIESREAEKKNILKVSRGQEKEYQKVISDKLRDAATIRATLFELRGSSAIPFGKALEYATLVSAKTGVRPAFILGIIAEESNLGENVGTGSWLVDMPERDKAAFIEITSALGLNPDNMPVSKRPWYGWGGAMGPAQFIPSTWVLYQEKVKALTGRAVANPWDPLDAFMAAGILLKDNGASVGTRSAERLAALRYLAGWKNATKKAYAFYGDDVMELADKYEKQIGVLNGLSLNAGR